MFKRTDIDLIEDMLICLSKIEQYIHGIEYDDFVNDYKTQDAIIRNLEVIGEASKQISSDIKGKHQNIPWKMIAGTRDRLIHGYFGVNIDIVWEIVTIDAPTLKQEIGKIKKLFPSAILGNQSGFTLIEVLIALFIFAVGILGVQTMQITAINGNHHSNRITESSNLAVDQLEIFISQDFNHNNFNDVNYNGTNQDTNKDGIDDDGGNFGLDDIINADGHRISTDGTDQIFWNIAVDHPVHNTKTIKIIIDPAGSGENFSMMLIKSEFY